MKVYLVNARTVGFANFALTEFQEVHAQIARNSGTLLYFVELEVLIRYLRGGQPG
jgi:hypothetical protein